MIGGMFIIKLVILITFLDGSAISETLKQEFKTEQECKAAINHLKLREQKPFGSKISYDCQVHEHWREVEWETSAKTKLRPF